MDWLNYHHLLYFRTVAREGTVTAAADKLRLARPTVTAQIRQLEDSLGQKLFAQRGRRLALTDFGQRVLTYADEIFIRGEALSRMVNEERVDHRERLVVGLPNVMPKLVAFQLLRSMPERSVHLVCREAEIDDLLADLALHRIDLVLSDALSPTRTPMRTFNHKLGECGVAILGSPGLARKHRRGFPMSLAGAPIILPTDRTAMRRGLDQWFQEQGIEPDIKAEFDDSALMKVFGESGLGLFPVPTIVEKHVRRRHGIDLVGRLEGVSEEFHAISLERTIRRPLVREIILKAKESMFPDGKPRNKGLRP